MNNIELAKVYTSNLDEVYAEASKTSILDGAQELARAGVNANEIVIPKMDLSGLGNYSTSTGYPDGDVNVGYETRKCEYLRGRKFNVDKMDDLETAGVAFGKLAGQFERTKVAPELDAYRLAKYASTEGIGTASADLKDGKAVCAAIRKALVEMDNAEVPEDGRILYITSDNYGLVKDMDNYASREVLNAFSQIVKVPKSRFANKIDLLDDGFKKSNGALDLNFEIIHKDSVIQFVKRAVPKIILPEQNQNADGYIFAYRVVAIADVYDNKKKGIYAHTVATQA